MSNSDGLNERQQRFVTEYLRDFNATAAYGRAGYTAKGNAAEVNASKLLRNAKVQRALAQARERLWEDMELDKEYVLKGLRHMYQRGASVVPVYDREGNPTGEYTFQGQVANKALELIGKELGMFQEKLDVTSAGDAITRVEILRPAKREEEGAE